MQIPKLNSRKYECPPAQKQYCQFMQVNTYTTETRYWSGESPNIKKKSHITNGSKIYELNECMQEE